MSHDLGDPVPLAILVKNSSGVAENAGTVVLTVTLPDLTTTAPSVSNPSAGSYTATYTPTQAGRHVARWVATGANASAFVDVFDVRQSTPPYIVSLAEARTHLNITPTDTDDDEELRRYIEAATEVVEGIVGPVAVRQFVERHDSGSCLVLQRKNALSLVSVEPWGDLGTSYATNTLRLNSDTGIVERLDGGYLTGGPFAVTYKAGMTIVPASVTEAALELIRINYRSHTGERSFRYERGDAEYIPEERPDLGFFIPNGIYALLRPHADLGGIA